MIKYYKTDNGMISEINDIEEGAWINMISPTEEESNKISSHFNIDIDDIKAALDEEESARINIEENYTMILVDIPMTEIRHGRNTYTTIPLSIFLLDEYILTVCAQKTAILSMFVKQHVREFSTKKRMRFTYQILYRSCVEYQSNLRFIDKKRIEVESRINESTQDSDLIDLHELASNLVYFATSLRANGLVLDRLTRYARIKQYPEDKELLEDVIIENKQAIEMTQIYRDIIDGTRDLMSTIINNRLNNVMKYLAAVTIVMSIPTIISGLYGMNVDARWMPLATTTYGFGIVCIITLVICILTILILRKRKML